MDRRMIRTKRGFELEEQNGKGSKKLCQAQSPNSQCSNSQALSSYVQTAHHTARDLPGVFPDQNIVQISDLHRESRFSGTVCADLPEVDAMDFTTYFEHWPIETPQALSITDIINEDVEINYPQVMRTDRRVTSLWTQPPHIKPADTTLDVPDLLDCQPKNFQAQHDTKPSQEFESAEDKVPSCEEKQMLPHLEFDSTVTLLGHELKTESLSQTEDFEFDTCFGVISTKPSVSPQDREFDKPEAVALNTSGPIFKIYYEDSGKYAGIIFMPALAELLVSYRVKLKGFLSEVKSGKPLAAIKRAKSSRNKLSEYLLRIVIFGSADNKYIVGDFLSQSEMYLQHPSEEECDPNVNYFNPHFLVRAGQEMPKIEELSLSENAEERVSKVVEDDVARNRLLRMFDQADGIEVDLDATPSLRLQTDLMKHQLQALNFMIEKESGRLDCLKFPSLLIPVSDATGPGLYRHTITGTVYSKPKVISGGIIADEMGLGKTPSMLALICSHIDSLGMPYAEGQQSKTTLIVTPKSTLYGWQRQIARHIRAGQINSLVYHGSGKRHLTTQFDNVDIVLTTYETLRSDHILDGPLCSQRWLRLVLDEAHHIRNRESQVFAACCRVRAQYRWCLTGTPVQNSLDDYGALLSFLGVYPFQNKREFDRLITGPFQKYKPHAIRTLRHLVAATCLRRTKAKCNLSTPLPQRYEEVEEVILLPKDQEIYDFFKRKIQKIVIPNLRDHISVVTKQPERHNILSLITLLRVICDHVDLLPQHAMRTWKTGRLENSDKETVFLLTEASGEYGEDVESRRSQSPIPENKGRDKLQTEPRDLTSEVQSGNYYSAHSAKIDALLRKLRFQQADPTRQKPTKSVVFSAWTRMLDKVEQTLRAEGLNYQRIDGQSSLKSRAKAMKIFGEDSSCTVMLASIGSAGEGVDFTAAQYVHILEPHWNPMAEAQAIDRVHRIGQTLPVTVTRYIVPRSVESYIQWVQQDKLRMINLSLDTMDDAAEVEKKRWEKLKIFLQ